MTTMVNTYFEKSTVDGDIEAVSVWVNKLKMLRYAERRRKLGKITAVETGRVSGSPIDVRTLVWAYPAHLKQYEY